MSEEPKEKPIRELLEDISTTRDRAHTLPRGLVCPQLVSRITFFASLVCVLLTTVALLAVIWGLIDEVFAFRSIASMVVLLIALFIFRAINSQFD